MEGLVRKEQGKEFDWLHRKVKFKESSKIPDLLTPRRMCHALHPYSEFVSPLWIPINENSLGLSSIQLLIEDDAIFGSFSL